MNVVLLIFASLICILCSIIFLKNGSLVIGMLFVADAILFFKNIYTQSDWLYMHYNRLFTYILNKKYVFTIKSKMITDPISVESTKEKIKPVLEDYGFTVKSIIFNNHSNGITYNLLINGFNVKLKIHIMNINKDRNKLILKIHCPVKYRQILSCMENINLMHDRTHSLFNEYKQSEYAMYLASNSRVFNPFLRIKIRNISSFYTKFNYDQSIIKTSLNKIRLSSQDKKSIDDIMKWVTKPY